MEERIMKDCNGKEIKVGDSVKFVCTIDDLTDAGIPKDDAHIILNSIGKVRKGTLHENVVEVYVKDLGYINYWFFDNMIELV